AWRRRNSTRDARAMTPTPNTTRRINTSTAPILSGRGRASHKVCVSGNRRMSHKCLDAKKPPIGETEGASPVPADGHRSGLPRHLHATSAPGRKQAQKPVGEGHDL